MTAARVNVEHASCRTWAHWWRPYDARRDGQVWIADLECGRCRSHRFDHIHATTGRVVKRQYRHAIGYLRKGEGPMTADDRNRVRLSLVVDPSVD